MPDDIQPLPLFDAATVVRPAAVEGEWLAEVRDEFTIVNGHPNGGYLLALLGRAVLAADGDPDRHVIGATATYVSAPSVGPATVVTEVLRRGRTASHIRARLVQDDRTSVDVVMMTGALEDADPVWGEVPPPEMPSEEECLASMGKRPPLGDADAPPLVKTLRTAFDPATTGWFQGEPSGRGELRAWLRLADGRDWDPLSLLFAVDALPPATFDVMLTGWVPTLSLTAYIRAVPAPGPLRARFRAGVITGGRVDETFEVWDSTDRLVAHATQLAALRMP